MVLNISRCVAKALLLGCASTLASALHAQSLPDIAQAIPRDDPEYEPSPIFAGPLRVTLNGDARIEYDDNVFALPDDVTEDGIVVLSANTALTHRSGVLTTSLNAAVTARRFLDQTSQDSIAARLQAALVWEPREGEVFNLRAGWDRAIEDRGDPEARTATDVGPRQIDISSVRASYRRSRGKLLLDLSAEVSEFDAVSAIDDDRDFTLIGGTAKLGMRVGGQVFATASAFVTNRDFRIVDPGSGISRDANVYGASLGIDFVPGGLFEGDISVGVFRNDPSDPALDARTGLSVSGLLTYRPTRRVALVLDAFRGDVATFRGGAAGRVDTVGRVTWQQEIRHNLLSSASVGYRSSDFVDSGISEDTVIANAGLEYLLNRNLSLAGQLNFGSRESDIVLEQFDRFRGSVGIRFRF
jgi:hypothetical protein